MRTFFFLLLTTASLSFYACDPDDDAAGDTTGDFELNFKATYDGEALVMLDKVYTYPDGTPIKFQLFNYYVSNVNLTNSSQNTEELISEVAVIDYGDVYDQTTAEAGISLTKEDIPTGTYDQLQLGVGLSPDLNATQPGDYTAGHPLTDNFWSWARGYVFAKIEAIADLDGDGEFTDKLTYHIGETALYEALTFTQAISINSDATTTATVTVDLKKVMESESNFIDITREENTQDHTNDEGVYRFLWDNLTDAVSLQ